MRWGEIIVEVSAADRRRQRKAAAEKARKDELKRRRAKELGRKLDRQKILKVTDQIFKSLPKDQQERIMFRLANMSDDELLSISGLTPQDLFNKMANKNTGPETGKNAKPGVEEPAGIFADPKFDKYRVDKGIDTDFEGGYYLYFNITMRGVDLYWGRSVERFEQAKQFNQYKFMGREFDADKFQDVLNYIVRKTGRNGQPGYCSVVIPRRYLTHPYVQGAYSYLMTHYPQDDPTMDATVYWELV
jgi:hypothetical protein